MPMSATLISGFGVDLDTDCEEKFSDFSTSMLGCDDIGDGEFASVLIELWHMRKNGYAVPQGPCVAAREDPTDPEWKACHRLAQSESRHILLSLEIYGHCHSFEPAPYPLAIKDTVVEGEKLGNGPKPAIAPQAMADLQEFIRDFDLPAPDWRVVSLTC